MRVHCSPGTCPCPSPFSTLMLTRWCGKWGCGLGGAPSGVQACYCFRLQHSGPHFCTLMHSVPRCPSPCSTPMLTRQCGQRGWASGIRVCGFICAAFGEGTSSSFRVQRQPPKHAADSCLLPHVPNSPYSTSTKRRSMYRSDLAGPPPLELLYVSAGCVSAPECNGMLTSSRRWLFRLCQLPLHVTACLIAAVGAASSANIRATFFVSKLLYGSAGCVGCPCM